MYVYMISLIILTYKGRKLNKIIGLFSSHLSLVSSSGRASF
jgi:hypothetical protein